MSGQFGELSGAASGRTGVDAELANAGLATAYAWLDGQTNYERTLGSVVYNDRTFEREAFAKRLAALGNPHHGLRTIHIAGTRGKGSAALALETLLRASGQRTAVYTSPHLREYRERIRIDGQILPAIDFVRLIERIAALPSTAEGSCATTTGSNGGVDAGGHAFKTTFENLTALFFLAAREVSGCAGGGAWTVVETGLGGRLDATNVLAPGPVLLTRIGLEHTHLLGETIELIAAEKAAILKEGGWGVMAAQDSEGEAEGVFRRRAEAMGARLDRTLDLCPLRRLRAHAEGLEVEFELEGCPLTLSLPLYGDFQAENLQNALAMFARLREEELIPKISHDEIASALADFRVAGRMERVCRRPELFVDGGHCPTAAAALARAMAAHFDPDPQAGLIVGMMAEKDHDAFFRALASWPGWQWVWCYTVESPRAATGGELAQTARRYWKEVRVFENLKQILDLVSNFTDKNILLVATGSLYSVACIEDWGWNHGRASERAPENQAQTQ